MKVKEIEFGELYKSDSRNGIWKTSAFIGRGTPYVKMNELFSKKFISSEGDYELIELEEREKEKLLLNNEDLLFSRTSVVPEGVGKCSIICDLKDELAFDSNIIRVRLNNQICNPKYIFYYFNSPVGRGQILSLANGAAVKTIKGSDLKKLKINLLGLPTQRKIASILSAYDDLIENNLKRIKLLEEKAFVSYKLIVQNEKLEEFTIEELANVVMGQSPTSDTYTNEKEDNLPFHQGVTNFSKYFVEHKIYCKAPIKIAEEGDILFSVRAPVGRINFTSDKICIGRGLCAFRSKKGFQNYFYHQLKEFFFAEDVIGNGAIFNAVTKVELMKVKLKTPSEKIQQEFEVEAEQMYNLILNLTNQNTKLREARDILLPKLMNGQIEV